MIKGCIAIPSVDPKTWRSRGRKRKQTLDIPRIIEAKSPKEIEREKRRAKLPWGVHR